MGSFAKETYNIKEPTNRSHPIPPQTTSDRHLKQTATHWNMLQHTNASQHLCLSPTSYTLKRVAHPTATYTRVMARACIYTYIYIYEYTHVYVHMYTSPVAHMNDACHTYE